jgi:hypothetical protein
MYVSILLHGFEFFLRNHQSFSYGRISYDFMEIKPLFACKIEPATGSCQEPNESIP